MAVMGGVQVGGIPEIEEKNISPSDTCEISSADKLTQDGNCPLTTVGKFKKFQIYFSLFMCFVWVGCGANTIAMAFLTQSSNRLNASPSLCLDEPMASACEGAGRPLEPTECGDYFYADVGASVVSDFDLARCVSPDAAPQFLRDPFLASSAFFLGFLIGVALFGRMADLIGRRPVIYLSKALLVASGIWCAFTYRFWTFCLTRMLVGVGVAGPGLASFVLQMEITDEAHRSLATAIMTAGFAIGGCYVAVLAAMISSWRIVQLAVSLPGLLDFFAIFLKINIESPRWLLVKGRRTKAVQTWLQIADVNHMEVAEDAMTAIFDREVDSQRRVQNLGKVKEQKSETFFNSLCSWPLRTWMVALALLWFTVCLAYYGVYLETANLTRQTHVAPVPLSSEFESGSSVNLERIAVPVANATSAAAADVHGVGEMASTRPPPPSASRRLHDRDDGAPHRGSQVDSATQPVAVVEAAKEKFSTERRSLALATFLSFLGEIPAAFIAVWMCSKPAFGRRGVTVWGLFLCGVLCLLSYIFCLAQTSSVVLITILANAGRIVVSASFLMLYLYSTEILPTTTRSGAVGLLSVTARVAGILVPLVVSGMDKLQPGLPMLAFGVISCVIAIVCLRVLPETLGRPLYDTAASLQLAYAEEGLSPDLALLPCLKPRWWVQRHARYRDLQVAPLETAERSDSSISSARSTTGSTRETIEKGISTKSSADSASSGWNAEVEKAV